MKTRGASLALSATMVLGACTFDRDADERPWELDELEREPQVSETEPCQADEFVLGGECVACPEGTFNPAGNDPSGEDTRCDPFPNECGEEASCEILEDAYIKAVEPSPNAKFGRSLDIDGDTLVVSAYRESYGPLDEESRPTHQWAGAVHVYTRAGGEWEHTQRIVSPRENYAREFGEAVSVSGDTLAVSQGGYVFVYERRSGQWSHTSTITEGDEETSYRNQAAYGATLSLDGDTLVVGAYQDYSAGSTPNFEAFDRLNQRSGAAFVYTRNARGEWPRQAFLKGSNTRTEDDFGWAISLDGDRLAVGSYDEDSRSRDEPEDNSLLDSGAVYIFERDASGAWSEASYIKASAPMMTGWFGRSVSLDGDRLAVGARGEDHTDGTVQSGAAYVFERGDDGRWVEAARVEASLPTFKDYMGFSIALEDDLLAVGIQSEDSASTETGAPALVNEDTPGSGAVVIYRRIEGRWVERTIYKASNADEEDKLGWSMAMDSGTLAVSAVQEDSSSPGVNGDREDDSTSDSGAVYTLETRR